GRTNEQSTHSPRRRPCENCGLIASGRMVKSWRFKGAKTRLRIVAIHCQLTAFATCNDQVIPAVAVQIEPGDAGAKLTQSIGQKRLAREIVELFFMMFVSQQLADLLKYRPRFGVRGFFGA